MAERRPLVLIGGRNKELPVGDTISWSWLSGKPTTLSGYGITDAVPSSRTVNGKSLSANVTLTAGDVGAEPAFAAGTSAQYRCGDKTWQTLNKAAVGLGNVDNTSDADKPVSTAQAAAIAAVTVPAQVSDWDSGASAGFIAGPQETLNAPGTGYYSGVRFTSLAHNLTGEVVIRASATIPEAFFRGWSLGVPTTWQRLVSASELGTAAAASASSFATAAQGNLADNSLQKSGGTLTGALQISGAAGTVGPPISFQRNGVSRWQLYADSTAEAGGDSGSNFAVVRYSDSGAYLGAAFRVRRANGNVYAGIDNNSSMGEPPNRWSTIYAGTGTINTSDAREKTPVRPLTEAELAAAISLGREIGVYQWLSMIGEKGEDAARLHVGMTVQRAIEIMQGHGLDPMRYGFICYDEWDETPERCEDTPEELDEEGNVLREAGRVLVDPYRPAGNRYSFRMDELLAFIARGFAARLDAIEARLAV